MPSYEPVDLSAACNVGVEVLGDEPGDVPLGRMDLRGLPFLIGPEPPSAERCLLLPGAPTSVGIGRMARRVIVAHRLLEPGAPTGHAVGQAVAVRQGDTELGRVRWDDVERDGRADAGQVEQQGEDLRVVNVLQTQWGALFTNTEDFSGRPSVSQHGVVDGGGYVTYVGQENRQHALGHMLLWGLKEPVMPWCNDGPDEAELGGALDATLSDWAARTHAQGGTVVAAHFPNPNGESAVLVATGRADAVEILSQTVQL